MEEYLGEGGGTTLSPRVASLLEGPTPPLLCWAHFSLPFPKPLLLTGALFPCSDSRQRDLMAMSWVTDQPKNSSSSCLQPGPQGPHPRQPIIH